MSIQAPARKRNRELSSLGAATPTSKGRRRAKATQPDPGLLVDADGQIDRTPIDKVATKRVLQAILDGKPFTVWRNPPPARLPRA